MLDFLKSHPLPDYSADANKADYGKLLLIAGSRRIPGAAILATRAALRAGCGTVRLAAPESVAVLVGIAVPELMVIPLPETSDGTISEKSVALIAAQCKECDAIVLGPGLDENAETDKAAREIFASAPIPLVVDAQALTALGAKFETPKAARIFTPHQKEFEALSNGETAEDWAKTHKAILVLKGRETLICAPDGETVKNEAGTRGLGTAGSGDVLAGLIGSFLTQGLEPQVAAAWGVHIHALAGEAVAKDLGDDGLNARDLIERIPGVQKYLRRLTAGRKETKGYGLRSI